MPPQAFAILFMFLVFSVLLALVAVRLVARMGGPRTPVAYLLPFGAAFGAFYLIGHRLGVVLGPEVELFGFQVALLGDLAIGFAAALLAAGVQALVVRALARRSGRSAAA
jgi:hypothetical protein